MSTDPREDYFFAEKPDSSYSWDGLAYATPADPYVPVDDSTGYCSYRQVANLKKLIEDFDYATRHSYWVDDTDLDQLHDVLANMDVLTRLVNSATIHMRKRYEKLLLELEEERQSERETAIQELLDIEREMAIISD